MQHSACARRVPDVAARGACAVQIAFSAEAPHVATALDCDGAGAGHCLRLILSFSGDNAAFDGGRQTGLIPLHDNQTDGSPPHGVQFPRILPNISAAADEGDWQPLRPRLGTLGASLVHALRTGAASFAGFSYRKQAVYVARVAWFCVPWNSWWDYPAVEDEGDVEGDEGSGGAGSSGASGLGPTARRHLSLVSHFGLALLEWARGGDDIQ